MLGRRGRASMPGWGLAAIQKKKACCSPPHGRTGIFVTLVPPMSRKQGWASPFWASPYSLGEPSNEVGRATKGPLGEPVLSWASPY